MNRILFPIACLVLFAACKSESVKPQKEWAGTYEGTYTFFYAALAFQQDTLDPNGIMEILDTTYESSIITVEVSVDRSERIISFTGGSEFFPSTLITDGEFVSQRGEGCFYDDTENYYDPYQDEYVRICFTEDDSLIIKSEWATNYAGGVNPNWALTFAGKK